MACVSAAGKLAMRARGRSGLALRAARAGARAGANNKFLTAVDGPVVAGLAARVEDEVAREVVAAAKAVVYLGERERERERERGSERAT